MNEAIKSVNGVSIGLNAERWMHITMGHPGLADYYFGVLQTLEIPDVVYLGNQGESLAACTLPEYLTGADNILGDDPHLQLPCTDAGTWLEESNDQKFDLIFADAWPGKYTNLDAVLGTLAKGGMYVIA